MRVPKHSLKTIAIAIVATVTVPGCSQSPIGQAIHKSGLTNNLTTSAIPRQQLVRKPIQKAAPVNTKLSALKKTALAYNAAPLDATAAVSYANELMKQDYNEQAELVLSNAYKIHQFNPLIASMLGRTSLKLGKTLEAEKALTVAVKHGARDWQTMNGLGIINAQQGRTESAITYFKQALSSAPGKATILNNLAMTYGAKGDLKTSERYLAKAMLAKEHSQKVRGNMGLIYGLQGKTQQANMISGAGVPTQVKTDGHKGFLDLLNIKSISNALPSLNKNTKAAPIMAKTQATGSNQILTGSVKKQAPSVSKAVDTSKPVQIWKKKLPPITTDTNTNKF